MRTNPPGSIPTRISWTEVADLQAALLELLPHDRFLAKVLEGVVRVARDKANPIRGNLAASALRELVSHVLHRLAPEQEVRRCAWFAQDPSTSTVTRRQRAKYIVHAGLRDVFVSKTLKLDVAKSVKPILDAMGTLNRATHVTPHTIVHKGHEVRAMTRDTLAGLLGLLNAAAASRDRLKTAIEGVIERALFDRLIMNTISELDELSTHTVADDHYIDTLEVQDVNATEVKYLISGKVDVELQYGSNADVRRDIGFRKSDSYPYRATVSSDIATPLEIHRRDLNLTVDTSSFYE